MWHDEPTSTMNMLYDSGNGTCLATSSDGYAWERANLGQVAFEDSGTANSLLAAAEFRERQ